MVVNRHQIHPLIRHHRVMEISLTTLLRFFIHLQMKTYMTCIRLPILRLAILFLLFTIICGNVLSSPNDEDKNLHEYYSFLESITSDSQLLQIQKSKSYLEKHPDFKRIYFHLFHQLAYLGKIKEAETYFDSLKNIPVYRRNSLWVLAHIYDFQENYPKAFNCYKQAIKTGPITILLIENVTAFLYRQEKNYNQLSEIEQLNLPSSYKTVSLAFYYYLNGNYSRANEMLTNETGTFQKEPTILHVLGFCHYKLRNFQKAESYWSQCLTDAQKKGDIPSEIRSLISLGINKTSQGDTTEFALNNYKTSLLKAEKINHLSWIQYSLGQLGIHYKSKGYYKKAIKNLNDAITIGEKIGAHKIAAQFYMMKAQCLKSIKKYQDSFKAYEKSKQLAKKSNHKDLITTLSREKGILFETIGLFPLAKREYQNTYEAAKSRPFANLNYRTLYHYADMSMQTGDYKKARDLNLEVLSLPRDKIDIIDIAFCHDNLGLLYYLEKDYDQAKIHFQKTIELAKSYGNWDYAKYLQARSRLKLGNIEEMVGDPSKALDIYTEDFIVNVADKEDRIKIEQNYYLGNYYQKQNKINEAIQYYTKAFNIIENQREEIEVDQFRIGYFSENIDIYHALTNSYLDQFIETRSDSSLENLFYFMETSRARGLQDLIVNDKSLLNSLTETTEYRNYQKACLDLTTLQRKIRDNPQHVENYAVNLGFARYDLLHKRLQLFQERINAKQNLILSLKSALKQLNTINSGLLFYHISDKVSFVLAACNNEAKIVKLQTAPTYLTAAIDSLISPFHNSSKNSVDKILFRAELSHRLYNLLFKPIEDEMTLPSHLLIVPDRALVGLPFEMLLTKPTDLSEYTPNQTSDYSDYFLLHRYSILYSPFTWLKLETDNSYSKNPNILVFANPTEPIPNQEALFTAQTFRSGWDFDVLLFAEEEAKNIEQLHSDVTVFKREKATKVTFLNHAANYGILHLATHAKVDSIFDAFSGLALAVTDDSTDDGLLMGYEISDLNLKNCELVTMSACETGRGQKAKGEGLLGLPRIFLGAGANQVVMTSWKIADQFSSKLMTRFYDNFLNKKMLKSEALQAAKCSLLSNKDEENNLFYQHPFFWASYSIYGKPEIPSRPNNLFKFGLIVTILLMVMVSMGYFLIYKKSSKSKVNI